MRFIMISDSIDIYSVIAFKWTCSYCNRNNLSDALFDEDGDGNFFVTCNYCKACEKVKNIE